MRRILLILTVGLVLIPTGQTGENSTQSQLRQSANVLSFFDNHSWLHAPNKEKCSQVPWWRTCIIARELIKKHTARIDRIDRNDPIIARLNRGLAGTPMAGLGETLRDIGRTYNVSPYFMAAVAGTESSFGHAGCSNNPKNVWGLAACDGRWYVPYFNSWNEAITFYAKFLSSRWPSATSPYQYYGYAACDQCWGRKTAYWMSARFGVSAYTKYPQ